MHHSIFLAQGQLLCSSAIIPPLLGLKTALCILKETASEAAAVAYRGGGLDGSTPLPEFPKALQNRAKLNPIVKT